MSKEKKSKLYTTKYIVTIKAYTCDGGLYREFIVKRICDNIFHLKYYIEHYKDVYKENFTIIKVLNKEKISE